MADLSIITLSVTQPYVEALTQDLAAAMPDLRGVEVERILINNAAGARRSTYHPMTKWAARNGWAVIEPGYNTSFSTGCNFGAKAASGDYLLLLNDDVRLGMSALGQLWAARGAADVVGCLICHADGTVNHAGTKLVPWPDHVGRGAAVSPAHIGTVAREAVTFACALVTKEMWDRLGGLDERFHYSFEDTDFCLRVLEAGGRIACALGARVTHDECGTRERHGPRDRANAETYRELWPAEKVEQIVGKYWARENGGANGD